MPFFKVASWRDPANEATKRDVWKRLWRIACEISGERMAGETPHETEVMTPAPFLIPLSPYPLFLLPLSGPRHPLPPVLSLLASLPHMA